MFGYAQGINPSMFGYKKSGAVEAAPELYATFTGSNDRFDAPTQASFNLAQPDIRARVHMASTAPGVTQGVVDQGLSSADRAYLLTVEDDGRVQLKISTTGSHQGANGAQSSVVLPTSLDGTEFWIRGVYDSTANTITLYYSTDQTMDENAVTWTQLGTTQSVTGGGAANASAEDLNVGRAEAGGSKHFAGRIYRVTGRERGGAIGFDFHPTQDASGAGDTSFVSGSTGETYTARNSAAIASE